MLNNIRKNSGESPHSESPPRCRGQPRPRHRKQLINVLTVTYKIIKFHKKGGFKKTMYTTPRIIEKSYNGIFPETIEDKMFTNREICCFGEITPELVDSLIQQILYLAQSDPEADIKLYFDSSGGIISCGFSLLDVMNAVPCDFQTVAIGTCASMAAVIFSSGTRGKRSILKHGSVLLHDPLTRGLSGSALEIASASEDLMRTRQVICEILAENTGRSVEEVQEKTCSDTYFYAPEAVEFGLCDNIIHTI